MSKNIVAPRTVSFEEALRNLASRLTGRPASQLPRTQEAIVQYMAENLPAPAAGAGVKELEEAITQEVLARITGGVGAHPAAAEADRDGPREDAEARRPKAARRRAKADQ